MNNIKDAIDTTITPENAKSKGYKLVLDIICDRRSPNNISKDLLDLITNEKCKLGKPARSEEAESFYGLYIPTRNQPWTP
jgi:hypothetical protein